MIPARAIEHCGAVLADKRSCYRRVQIMAAESPLLCVSIRTEYTSDAIDRGAMLVWLPGRIIGMQALGYFDTLGEALDRLPEYRMPGEPEEYAIFVHPADMPA